MQSMTSGKAKKILGVLEEVSRGFSWAEAGQIDKELIEIESHITNL